MATVQKMQASTQTQRTKSTKAPAGQTTAGAQSLSSELIAARAYQIWEESGCPQGCEQDHWYQAERELLQRS